MYLWRRPASSRWWEANQPRLEALFAGKVAVIGRPGRKRLEIEVACESARELRRLKSFGGRVHKLPRNWLEQYAREQKTKPLKIGRRLIITNVGGASAPRRSPRAKKSGYSAPSRIFIPAGAAFGTGQHATTAMSLRMLERAMRHAQPPNPLVADLGTGSGIFALAARSLGARHVVAIDVDPAAISTAKENARRNRIGHIDFQVADARRFRVPGRTGIVMANLFSELLIPILPRLKTARVLILSGVLRQQEAGLMRVLRANRISVGEVRRRGKWIAILATTGTRRST